jgi:hypothetical protein
VPRPRRNRRPPGNAHLICTGRGDHGTVSLSPAIQFYEDDQGRLRIRWDRRQGPGPVTGYSDKDGLRTCEVRCGTCGRHLKRREDKLGLIAMALAGFQGITGNDNTPITIDISRIERV